MPRIKRRITWKYLLDVHGRAIGAALCALSTVLVGSWMVWLFMLTVSKVTR